MIKISLSVIIILLMSGCSKTTLPTATLNNIQIATGRQCGWCAGKDSLTMNQSVTEYIYEAPCDDSDIAKKENTNTTTLEELVNLLDFEAFKKIEINSCDICFDGCDTWVWVKKGNEYHRIQFGASDSAVIQSILPFLVKLESVKKNYGSNP